MLEKSLKKQRLDYIDIAKGVGILLVMLGHLFVYEPNNISSKLSNFIYSFHLPMFFIITGILFNKNEKWKNKSLKNLIWNKFKSLIFPYFLFAILLVLFHTILVFVFHIGMADEITDMIYMTITFKGYGTLWYLPTLFCASIMFYVFERFNLNKYAVMVILIITGSFLAFKFPMFSYEFGILNSLISYYVTRFVIACSFIYIGFVSKELSKFSMINNKYFCFIFGLILLILTFFFCQYNGKPDLCIVRMGNTFIYYILSITGSFSVIILCKAFEKILKIFKFFGKNSLTIMATHGDFVVYCLVAVRRIVPVSILTFGFEVLLTYLLLIIVEIILVIAINKWLPFIIRFPNFKKIKGKSKFSN